MLFRMQKSCVILWRFFCPLSFQKCKILSLIQTNSILQFICQEKSLDMRRSGLNLQTDPFINPFRILFAVVIMKFY